MGRPRGPSSNWAGEDFREYVAVAVGLVFGAVAEDGDGGVLGETLKEAEGEFLAVILDGAV
jgi:hypothetical protein